MKILYVKWLSYIDKGVERALNSLHIDYTVFEYIIHDWENDEILSEKIKYHVNKKKYDAVFMINYSPIISYVCQELGIRYICWVYDSPMDIRDINSMKNSCNEIYLFDRGQVELYKQMGVNMKHLPLAADCDSFQDVIIKNKSPKYYSDVALVGKLYVSDYDSYIGLTSEYTQGYIEAIMQSQKKMYMGNIIHELVTDEVMERINNDYKKAKFDFAMKKNELDYMLSCEITKRERVFILSLLAKYFDTHLYTSEHNVNINNLKVHEYVDYYEVMPLIFSNSKVNLNSSLRAIKTGIPLRCLDVLGCGGFLLSNRQEEILENFVIGDEVEVYNCIEELFEKVQFYVKNDSLREQIAVNGFAKVKKYFSFEERIRFLLD